MIDGEEAQLFMGFRHRLTINLSKSASPMAFLIYFGILRHRVARVIREAL
jgi:hypothetical protein